MHKLILKQLKKYKIEYMIVFIFYIINVIFALLEPVIFGRILDSIINNVGRIDFETKKNIVFLISILLVQYITNYIYRRVLFPTSRKVKQGILNNILEKLEKAKIEFFDKTDKGKFVSYIINDITYIWSIMSHGTIELIRLISFTVFGFIFAVKYVNLPLAIAVFITFPMFIYFIFKQNAKAQKLLYEKKEEEAKLSKHINDSFCGFSVIKSYVTEEETLKQFNEINNDLKNKNIEYNKITSSINSIVTFFQGLGFSISCIFGLYLVVNGSITIGSFIAFNSIIQKVMKDYLYAGFLVEKANMIKIIYKRIEFLYDIETNTDGNIKMPENANIQINNLNFKYKGEKENILENINLSIPAGSFIGILGKTGSGKTTLANILAKFYEIPTGKIFFNDIDINDIERKSFYEKFAYVMQDDYIYDNTIKHNIELYKNYEKNEVKEATKKAELFDTIEKLDKKYDTLIGDNGIKLSGGQKQRLILSRNLITNPNILIIDNGFTGLDIDTRKKVIDNLNNRNNKATLVIISSMMEDIKNADKIYKLENKTLVEINMEEEVYDA
ncbi:MAG: ABC transporter ATP-binding protein [Clostridia bacterium]|nr:xenobiotic-transporting ATPase [Clostridium sp. CAG:389]